jgi:hypothetical protein
MTKTQTTQHPAIRSTVDFFPAKSYHLEGHTDFSGGGWNITDPYSRRTLRFTYRHMRKHGVSQTMARHLILSMMAMGNYDAKRSS